jgi:hypothetical protein
MTNTDTANTSSNLRNRQIQQLADYIEDTALAALPLPPEFF